MGQVVASRAFQGAGGAGMVSMVSVVITDLVPIHEVALLRSYVNILQTTGRSCGGVIGGLLTQALGWRWAFLIQVPPMILAIALVQWRLHITPKHLDLEKSHLQKLKRIDFIGSFFLCSTILAICFILDMGGQKVPWNSWIIVTCGIAGGISAICFVISACYVLEPVFPLRMLAHYSVLTNCAMILLLSMIQISLMVSVPIFFQATRKASVAASGVYLIPAFAGNTFGGLLAGYWIKKTGHFKTPTVLAPLCQICCTLLCLFIWRKDTSDWISLAIFPGGFAMGLISSSAFVGLAAGVDEKDLAIAASGMYLYFNIGGIAGVSTQNAVFETALRSYLPRALAGYEDTDKVRPG
jgi:MFS family permease